MRPAIICDCHIASLPVHYLDEEKGDVAERQGAHAHRHEVLVPAVLLFPREVEGEAARGDERRAEELGDPTHTR